MKAFQINPRWAILAVPLLLGAGFLWNQNRAVAVPGYALAAAPYTDTLLITGKVQLDNTVTLKTEVEGTVAEKPLQAGTAVKAGDVLLKLANPELELALSAAEAALAEAEATRQKAAGWSPQAQAALLDKLQLQRKQLQDEHDRTAALYSAGAASEVLLLDARSALAQKDAEVQAEAARLEDLEKNAGTDLKVAAARVLQAASQRDKAKLQVERLTLRAPFDGIVTASDRLPADRLPPGSEAVTVARSQDKTCEIAPDEKYLPLMKPGQPVTLKADARPQDLLAGTVDWIAPEVDPQSGTAAVRIRITTDRPWLIRNLMLRCEILLGEYPESLSVPADYLIPGESPSLLLFENGTAVQHPVTVSAPRTGQVRILSGATAGDIVLPPQSLLPGQRVRLAKPEGGGP